MAVERVAALAGRLYDPRAVEIAHVDVQPVRRQVRDLEQPLKPTGSYDGSYGSA